MIETCNIVISLLDGKSNNFMAGGDNGMEKSVGYSDSNDNDYMYDNDEDDIPVIEVDAR